MKNTLFRYIFILKLFLYLLYIVIKLLSFITNLFFKLNLK